MSWQHQTKIYLTVSNLDFAMILGAIHELQKPGLKLDSNSLWMNVANEFFLRNAPKLFAPVQKRRILLKPSEVIALSMLATYTGNTRIDLLITPCKQHI